MVDCARCGEVLREIMLTGAGSNKQGGHHGNALQVVSAINHDRIAKLLLGRSCHVYTSRTSEQAAIVNKQG